MQSGKALVNVRICTGLPELENVINTKISWAGSYGDYSDFLFAGTHHTQANLAFPRNK